MGIAVLKQVGFKLLGYFREDYRDLLQRNVFSEYQRGLARNEPTWTGKMVLPQKYGRGLPERVVELLFARRLYEVGHRVLDVGHANAQRAHLMMIRSLPDVADVTGLDIADPVFSPQAYYRASIMGDITNSGFPDRCFNLVWCISTLEHFGMDNSLYTNDYRRGDDLASRALHEMLRVLACEGRLLVTVPFGRYENHSRHINYDYHTWQALLEPIRSHVRLTEWYFRHTFGSGWCPAEPRELEHVGYYDQANAGSGGLAVAVAIKDADG
jgi:SAM-dependent methyltransferase